MRSIWCRNRPKRRYALSDEPYGATVRDVVLSFDDGPDEVNTPKLLDVLAKHRIRAVFFVLGKNLVKPFGRQILRRIHAEGHWIGNHTYTHPDLTKLHRSEIRDEIARTAALIGDADRGIKIFRPPYGSSDQQVDQIARELKYRRVLWNVDTTDYKEESMSGAWLQNGLSQIRVRQCSVILAHDALSTTVGRMDEFIAAIKEIPLVRFPASRTFIKRDMPSIQFGSLDAGRRARTLRTLRQFLELLMPLPKTS
jgi:peptidoglycan/xylan/chitin deacetylase (PgdA/CDA1 family)